MKNISRVSTQTFIEEGHYAKNLYDIEIYRLNVLIKIYTETGIVIKSSYERVELWAGVLLSLCDLFTSKVKVKLIFFSNRFFLLFSKKHYLKFQPKVLPNIDDNSLYDTYPPLIILLSDKGNTL